jgi:hypothetical protein
MSFVTVTFPMPQTSPYCPDIGHVIVANYWEDWKSKCIHPSTSKGSNQLKMENIILKNYICIEHVLTFSLSLFPEQIQYTV